MVYPRMPQPGNLLLYHRVRIISDALVGVGELLEDGEHNTTYYSGLEDVTLAIREWRVKL